MDYKNLQIERYLSAGLSPQQAEQLANASKYNSPPLGEYESALQRRVDTFHSASDKAASKSFMDSFRNNKPEMTTEKFFDKSIDYKTDPGAGKVSDKYMDAIKKQRIKPNLNIVENNNGMADLRLLLLIEGARKALEIPEAGAGSDMVPR